jgi:NarL family two-component system response regulator LiaR
MSAPITILLVDNHTIVRRGLRVYLDSQSDFSVVGEAGSGGEALLFVVNHIPDIVLLDMSLSDMDGIEVTTQIKNISPRTQVVIRSSLPEEYDFLALRAGAVSYLPKNMKMDEMADALRCARRGEAALPPHVAASILRYLNSENSLFLVSLSNREIEILRLVAGTLTNSQIAQKIQTSERTVKGHIGNIREKLQIADRLCLALFNWENEADSPSGKHAAG